MLLYRKDCGGALFEGGSECMKALQFRVKLTATTQNENGLIGKL